MEIPLTQGKVAQIDPEDLPLIAPYKWYAKLDRSTGLYYAYNKSHRLIMHRVIAKALSSQVVDHIVRDGLNNRRGNLRCSDNFRNQQKRGTEAGSSKYKCVSWISQKQKWRVRFKWLGQDHFVGYFDDEKEAALAYNTAILPLAGEYAVLNQVA